jgi:hypothetical protein
MSNISNSNSLIYTILKRSRYIDVTAVTDHAHDTISEPTASLARLPFPSDALQSSSALRNLSCFVFPWTTNTFQAINAHISTYATVTSAAGIRVVLTEGHD